MLQMVATKHCCWGECKSDSRFPHLLHPALKKRLQEGKPIFLPFPKKSQGLERCLRWVNACGRGKDFTVDKVTKYTYICYLHWPGETGPTKEFDVPLKATLKPKEVLIATKPKRKAPRARDAVPSKRRKSGSNQDKSHPVIDEAHVNHYVSGSAEVTENSRLENDQEKSAKSRDIATQTDVSKHELSYKLEAMMMMRNAAKSKKSTNIVSNISYELIKENSELMKHFVGLTPEQFDVLYNFLNDVCPLQNISYWSYASKGKRKCDRATKSRATNSISKWSSREKLYICLLRLRTGFTIKTLSVLLSTPDKPIKGTAVRDIFTTFIQLMYKIFREMEDVMFPTRETLRRFLPRVFKTMKNVRCTVDCTEFRIQTSRNFAQQGNTYSQYKHSNTFKCLIAVTPNGGACFVSDLFEGDITDIQIFEESGILKHINPYDIILADRGFTVQDLLNPLQAKLMIPSFLKGRKNLSAAEELSTRKIAKARIHIERFNQRLKSFRLLGKTIPLTLAAIATQMVVVACGLVNFQQVLCK